MFGFRILLPFFGAFTFLVNWHLAALKESIMTLQNLAKLDTLVGSSDEKRECIVRVSWFLSCFFGIYATLS